MDLIYIYIYLYLSLCPYLSLRITTKNLLMIIINGKLEPLIQSLLETGVICRCTLLIGILINQKIL